MLRSRGVILRDPVHGLISFQEPLDEIVVRLLDTAELQRLRRIRCLGPASLAFPGAEHSRFAHAVGSAYVMKRYLHRVHRLGDDIPQRDRIDGDSHRIALAAALLHDLGHGPWSHAFEAVVPHRFVHEEWTSRLIMDPETQVHRVLCDYDPAMPKAVEALVFGRSPIPHLARAVSGTFDVDRCDYLLRDSHMTGVRYGHLDLDWLLESLRLVSSSFDAPARLAVDGEKGLTAVEGFFLGRLYMYRQVYLHKAVRAAEAILKALFRRLVELDGRVVTELGLRDVLCGTELSVPRFLTLDDHSLMRLVKDSTESTDRILRDLADRLLNRRLFKTIRLRGDVPIELARTRLDALWRDLPEFPEYYGAIDRVEIDAYQEDEAMMVLLGQHSVRLLEASPVLHGLSSETFVHYRAIFPPEAREPILRGLADLL